MILRNLLLYLSERRGLRRFLESSSIGRRITGRFIPGLTLEDGLAACARLNDEGILATLDHLGENVTSADVVHASRDAYLRALEQIAARGVQSTISIKLSMFGLAFSESDCRAAVEEVVQAAHRQDNCVEVDMESIDFVEPTLRLVTGLHAQTGAVRAVIQAYLRRSEQDVEQLCSQGIPVRLCKGAYKEPEAVAYVTRADVDASYCRLAERLIERGVQPAMATHDERIINLVVDLIRQRGMPQDGLEFQMLYGVRKSLQRRLVREGFRVRLYVPYGAAWYPYFMRRLAERPANLLFLARNMFSR